jgi:hypothetical protein
MSKLKMRGMESNPIDSPLRRFLRVVFSVADDRVPDDRKLRADLILQPCYERDPNQRSTAKRTLDRVLKFCAGRLVVSVSGSLRGGRFRDAGRRRFVAFRRRWRLRAQL